MTTTDRSERVVSRFGADTPALEVVAGIHLDGRRAIVTGGASGIGVETVRALASAGATVTIAARNLEAAEAVAEAINTEVGANRVDADVLFLDDLTSVRSLAERWGDKPLSILINNAGVMACPMSRTKDGFETQFGTNHLGHFLLTLLLAKALEAGAPSRVIVLSSAAHRYDGIDFNDPNYHNREYHPFKAYGQSKTANALFALEFDRRFRDRGVRAFSVMPGVITTNLGRHMTPELRAEMGFVVKKPGEAEAKSADENAVIRSKSVEAGAATSVWAATSRDLDDHGGLYLEDCAQALPFSKELPRGNGVMPYALDPDAAARLWDLSEELTGLR